MENVFESVARHAQQWREKVAVSKWRLGSTAFSETSYEELFREAAASAALLADLTPEHAMVPMLVGKSAPSIAAMLGAVATRRPFCFLNTKCRGPQIAAVLDATRAPVCFVDAPGLIALKGAWKEHPQIAKPTWLVVDAPSLSGIYLDAANALREAARVIVLPDGKPRADPQQSISSDPARPDRAATCLFTSGSTGKPKGVLVSEEDLIRRAAAEIMWFGLNERDVLLSILPFSFDVGLNQLMTALTVGAEVVLLDSWLPADILAVTGNRKVTGISGVPSIWLDMLKANARFDKTGPHAPLRYVTISGGSLAPHDLQQLAASAGGIQIFKTYGQTEAFRATSLRPEDYLRKLESVGRPFPGTHVYVVRDDGTQCDAGEVGEVVHTGLGIMMGYLEDVESRAAPDAKLRDNPYCGEHDPSRLAVFTGDMGYLDDEGYLFLKGRRDGMVKVMGNRVYPQEVAHQMVTIPGVLDAVVTGMMRADGQTVLVAFITVPAGTVLSAAAVRKALSAKVPAFMLPGQIVIVDQIPRTANGKPDHCRLVEKLTASSARTESLTPHS